MSAHSVARIALITVATMIGVSVLNSKFPAFRQWTMGG